VYHAAIRHPQQSTVVGGIGIVFDGAVELVNMLHAGVAGRPGMHAFFCSPDGRVLCGTDADIEAGAPLELDPALLAAAAAGGATGVSRIVVWRGQYCVAACSLASGYREFRTVAGREEPVLAVLLQSFGALRETAALAPPHQHTRIQPASEGGPDYALFHASGSLLALPADSVVEALPFAQAKRTPGGRGVRVGMLDVDVPGRARAFVWVFDLGSLLSGRASTPTPQSQVLLVRHAGLTLGLLVDDVHSVQQFDARDRVPLALAAGASKLSDGLIKANGGDVLVQELGVERVFAALREAEGTTA
jgi:chemotaxis signal transduction protein